MIAGELMQSYKKGTHLDQKGIGKLTPRQKEVLQLLAEGHSAKEIADARSQPFDRVRCASKRQ